MRLLDLFSGAGGAAMGYHRAGFEVVGVDHVMQPRYPFEHYVADALEFLAAHGHEFDAVHASPPCHDHSSLSARTGLDGTAGLLEQARTALRAWGGPYVIENVAGAPMPGALVLCGTEFGLSAQTPSGRRWLRRHRQFESNVFIPGAGGCNCAGRSIGGVYGDGGGGQMARGWKLVGALAEEAMGIDWMSRRELSQAIPPAYTRHVGEWLMAALTAGVAA